MSNKAGKRVAADPQDCQELAEKMLSLALAAGADAAEVLVRDGAELEVKLRMGEPELVKEAGSRGLGLRVLKDQRAAVTYTSDFSLAAMRSFAEESVALSRLAEPDPLAALPDRQEMARAIPELDLWDESVLSIDVAEAMRWTKAGEKAALGSDARVTNSEGASSEGVSEPRPSPRRRGSPVRTAGATRPSSSSPSVTTRVMVLARSAMATTTHRRAFSTDCKRPKRSASRPRGGPWPSWVRARWPPVRCRRYSRRKPVGRCSASSPA